MTIPCLVRDVPFWTHIYLYGMLDFLVVLQTSRLPL